MLLHHTSSNHHAQIPGALALADDFFGRAEETPQALWGPANSVREEGRDGVIACEARPEMLRVAVHDNRARVCSTVFRRITERCGNDMFS